MLKVIICSVLPTLIYSKVLNHNLLFNEPKTSNQEVDLKTAGASSIRKGIVTRFNEEKVLEVMQKTLSSVGKASECIENDKGVAAFKILGKSKSNLMNVVKIISSSGVSDKIDLDNEIVKVPNPQLRVSRSVEDSRQGRLAVDAEISLVMNKHPPRTRKAYARARKTKKVHHKPKSSAKLRRLTADLKLAKVALQLGVIVYKDVLPVVGALAISSKRMLKEKVMPAVVRFGHSARHKAGRVAEKTMKTLRAYAPLVKDTLKVTLNTVVGGVRQASREVSDVAQEFRKNYSSALAKMRARQAKEEVEINYEVHKASSPQPVARHRTFIFTGIVPR